MEKILSIVFIVFISNYGVTQQILHYNLSPCNMDVDTEHIQNRIISKEFTADTLHLSIGFAENCCISPKPVLTANADTLFLEIQNVSEDICACQCCFQIDITATEIKHQNFVLIYRYAHQDDIYPDSPLREEELKFLK